MGLIYLATPYSHPDPQVREEQFRVVNRVAADLMKQGLHIFSPISHTHPIALANDLPKGWEYWEQYDRVVLKVSEKLIVLRQSGWQDSVGVSAEIEIANDLNLCVEFIDP